MALFDDFDKSIGQQVMEAIEKLNPPTLKIKTEIVDTDINKQVEQAMSGVKTQKVAIMPEFVGNSSDVGKQVMKNLGLDKKVQIDIGATENSGADIAIEQKKQQLESLVTTAQEVGEKIGVAINDSIVSTSSGSRLQDLLKGIDVSDVNYATMSMKELYTELQNMVNIKRQLTTGSKSVEDLSDEDAKVFADAYARQAKIKNEILKIASGTERNTEVVPQGEFTSLEELKKDLEWAKTKLAELRQEAQSGKILDFNQSVEEAKELEAEIKRLQGIVNLFDTKQPIKQPEVSENSSLAPEQEETKIQGILGLLKETIATKAQLAKEKSSLPFAEDVEGAQARIKALEKTAKGLGQIWSSMGSNVVVNALKAIGSTAKTVALELANGLAKGFKTAMDGAKQLASSIAHLSSAGFNALKSAISTTLGNMKSLVSGGFHALSRGVSTVKGALDGLRSKMHSLTKKATPNLAKSLLSIKSMLMRRVKRTFISAIFNQAKQGIQGLAKYSESFNTAMSDIKNSAKDASGNLAVTLGNLVEMIAPAVQTLLGWFNKLLQAINSVFAILKGKSTITVAQKSTDNYAKSLKKASGSAKDLNHQLYGFDEITRQDDNSGSGNSGENKFEEQKIESALSDFIKMLIDNFKAGKFEEVGRMLAEKIDDIVKIVNNKIVEIRSKAEEWAENIARIFNGMLSEDLFTDLGELVGNGLNLVFGVVRKFLKKFNFKQLGKVLGLSINKMFDTVDWDMVGDTVASYFNGIWDYLGSLFETINWSNIGSKLSQGIMSLFNNLNWDSYKNAVSRGINGVFTMLYSFANNIEWGKIASTLNSNLTDLIENRINWGVIKGALLSAFNGLQAMFHEFANGDLFTSLAQNLGSVFGSLLDDIDWDSLTSDIGVGFAKLRTAFWDFINNLDLPSLASKLASGINNLFTDENVSKAWDESEKSVQAGIQSIIDSFSQLVAPPSEGGIDFQKIGETIGERVGDFVSSINWTQLSRTIATGLDRIALTFSSITAKIKAKKIGEKIADAVNAFFDPEKGGADLVSMAGNVAKGLDDIVGEFTSFLDRLELDKIRMTISEAVNNFFSGFDLANVITRIGDFVTDATTELFKLVDNIFNPVDEAGNAVESLGDKLSNGINGIFKKDNGDIDEEKFVNLGKSIGEAIKSVFTDINKFVTKTDWQAIGESIGNALGSIDWLGIAKSIITLLWNALVSAVNLVGGVVGAFIRKLFGINDVEIFNATGVKWAEELVDGFEEGTLEGSRQQKVALVASAYATGMADGVLAELDQQRQPMNDKAMDVANGITNAMAEALSENGDIEWAKQFLIDSLNISDAEAQSVVDSWRNNEMSALSFDDIFSGICNAGNKEELVAYFQSLGIELPENLINYLEQAEPNINAVAHDLIANLQNASTLEEAKMYFKQAGIDVGDAFASSIAGESTANIASALALLGMGVDEATITALDTTNLSANLDAYMKESGKDLATIAQELGSEVGDGIGFTIPDAIAKALGLGTKEVQRVKGQMVEEATVSTSEVKDGKEQAEQFGSETTGAIASATEEGKAEVEEKTEEVTSAVQQKYEALPDEVKPYAEKLMEYIVTALSDGDGTVKSAIEAVAQSAVDRAKEILGGDVGIEIGEAFINGIKNGIDNHGEEMSNLVSKYTGTAVNNAYLRMNEGNGFTIGSNMIIGMINGVNAYGQMLVDAIARICNVSAYTARQILGIHSPSKVFAEIGAYTMEGMEMGINATGNDAIDAVGEITKAIVEEAKNGDSIGSTVGYMSDGLDMTIDKMTQLAQIFNGIAETIVSMGGKLDIPTVASGKVIPYHSRVGASDTSGMSDINANSLEDAIYSAFTRAMGNDDNSQPIEIKLVVDGDTLANIVTRKQRQQQRARGVSYG